MKKVAIFTSSIILLITLLAGCSSKDEEIKSTSKNVETTSIETPDIRDVNIQVTPTIAEKPTIDPINSVEKENFIKYFNDVRPLVGETLEIAAYYEEIRVQSANGEIYDEDFAFYIYDDIIPSFNDVQRRVEGIITTPELRDTHELFIDALSKNIEGMSEIVSAIETGEMTKITSANDLLSQARKFDRDYSYKIQDLVTKYEMD